MQNQQILIFIPTRNTAVTLEKTYNLIPEDIRRRASFIVVDNASSDNSVRIVEKLGLTVIRHESDRGYGGSNNTAFEYARKTDADIFVVSVSSFR